MEFVCEKDMCNACGACVAKCPKQAISIHEELFSSNAVINSEKCIECGLCKKVCPQMSEVSFKHSIKWYQGWSQDENIRKCSTSGGIARALSESFISKGGCVCSCIFEQGIPRYIICDNLKDVKKMSGSKYVKSDMNNCYIDILEKLKSNIPVLFIGLPCHAEGVRKYVPENFHEKLYTVDLICHGTPSKKFFEMFLDEHGIDLKSLNDIKFRLGGDAQSDFSFVDTKGIMDNYSIAFLNSFSYTDNCYKCKFAQTQRASDITIGDSWGSELASEISKGVSLILCQSEKGDFLINSCEIELHDVDLQRAIEFNPQLKKNCMIPKGRRKFVNDVLSGKSIRRSVIRNIPLVYSKQVIKKVLIKLGVRDFGGYMISYKTK